MAWTTPRTWIAGELVTAALMNLHLRDNLNMLLRVNAGLTNRISSFGQQTLTFAGSPISDNPSFAHNLGQAPAFIQLTPVSGIAYCLPFVTSASSTNIAIQGRDTADTNRTGTNNIYWIAFA